jgi:hypothetical protein
LTADEYRACIKGLGLTPCRPSFQDSTLHQTRDGEFQQVPDAESLSPEGRTAMINLLKWRLNIETH